MFTAPAVQGSRISHALQILSSSIISSESSSITMHSTRRPFSQIFALISSPLLYTLHFQENHVPAGPRPPAAGRAASRAAGASGPALRLPVRWTGLSMTLVGGSGALLGSSSGSLPLSNTCQRQRSCLRPALPIKWTQLSSASSDARGVGGTGDCIPRSS